MSGPGIVASGTGGPQETRTRQEARLRQAAQEFEAILLEQMLKVMRGRSEERGFMAMGRAEGIIRDLHDSELGRSLARAGGIGLAGILIEALKGSGRG